MTKGRNETQGTEISVTGEAVMLQPLLTWLRRSGRIGHRTRIALELPWVGRRVDVAALAGGGTTTAFELKKGGLQRALEQAAYNTASFDRSWVVSANEPREEGIKWAESFGVGILVVNGSVRIAVPARATAANRVAAKRLRATIRKRGELI